MIFRAMRILQNRKNVELYVIGRNQDYPLEILIF